MLEAFSVSYLIGGIVQWTILTASSNLGHEIVTGSQIVTLKWSPESVIEVQTCRYRYLTREEREKKREGERERER